MKLEVELRRDIGRAKWHVWHGNIHDALELLSYTVFGLEGCADNDARAKAVTLLHELHGYLERNQGSIPSYAERHRAGEPTSRPLQIGGGSDFADCFDTSRSALCQRPPRRGHRFQHHDAKSMVWRAAHPEMPSPDL